MEPPPYERGVMTELNKQKNEHGFPYCGPPGDRLYKVGRCKVCSIPMFDDEPIAADLCDFCAGNETIRKPNARHKTKGLMIVEMVARRHVDSCGKSVIKMTDAARLDLASEIDAVIKARGDD